MKQSPQDKLKRRHNRVRAKVQGTHERPRLSVSRSVAHIQVQLIDDEKKQTIIGMSDISLKGKDKKATKTMRARSVGEEIAKLAIEKGIKRVTFDRGGNRFHGRVAAVAEGARKAGLEF